MTSTDNTAKRTQDRIGRATGIEVRVQGDNVGQLESAAIDRAQQFFGPALSLQVEGGYTAHEQSRPSRKREPSMQISASSRTKTEAGEAMGDKSDSTAVNGSTLTQA